MAAVASKSAIDKGDGHGGVSCLGFRSHAPAAATQLLRRYLRNMRYFQEYYYTRNLLLYLGYHQREGPEEEKKNAIVSKRPPQQRTETNIVYFITNIVDVSKALKSVRVYDGGHHYYSSCQSSTISNGVVVVYILL